MINRLDHFVLTISDLEKTKFFYCKILDMDYSEFGEGRRALHFGTSKINLHIAGKEFEPKAHLARPGTADLCFIIEGSLASMRERLVANGVPILEGPVSRKGATGPITSLYVRDPDLNLIELSVYE